MIHDDASSVGTSATYNTIPIGLGEVGVQVKETHEILNQVIEVLQEQRFGFSKDDATTIAQEMLTVVATNGDPSEMVNLINLGYDSVPSTAGIDLLYRKGVVHAGWVDSFDGEIRSNAQIGLLNIVNNLKTMDRNIIEEFHNTYLQFLSQNKEKIERGGVNKYSLERNLPSLLNVPIDFSVFEQNIFHEAEETRILNSKNFDQRIITSEERIKILGGTGQTYDETPSAKVQKELDRIKSNFYLVFDKSDIQKSISDLTKIQNFLNEIRKYAEQNQLEQFNDTILEFGTKIGNTIRLREKQLAERQELNQQSRQQKRSEPKINPTQQELGEALNKAECQQEIIKKILKDGDTKNLQYHLTVFKAMIEDVKAKKLEYSVIIDKQYIKSVEKYIVLFENYLAKVLKWHEQVQLSKKKERDERRSIAKLVRVENMTQSVDSSSTTGAVDSASTSVTRADGAVSAATNNQKTKLVGKPSTKPSGKKPAITKPSPSTATQPTSKVIVDGKEITKENIEKELLTTMKTLDDVTSKLEEMEGKLKNKKESLHEEVKLIREELLKVKKESEKRLNKLLFAINVGSEKSTIPQLYLTAQEKLKLATTPDETKNDLLEYTILNNIDKLSRVITMVGDYKPTVLMPNNIEIFNLSILAFTLALTRNRETISKIIEFPFCDTISIEPHNEECYQALKDNATNLSKSQPELQKKLDKAFKEYDEKRTKGLKQEEAAKEEEKQLKAQLDFQSKMLAVGMKAIDKNTKDTNKYISIDSQTDFEYQDEGLNNHIFSSEKFIARYLQEESSENLLGTMAYVKQFKLLDVRDSQTKYSFLHNLQEERKKKESSHLISH